MKEWLPSINSIIKTAIVLVAIGAITDLVGGKNWILSPILSWKNRNAA